MTVRLVLERSRFGFSFAGAVALACLQLACASQSSTGPTTQSSAGESSYAERYPDTISESASTVSEGEGDATRVTGELASYPDAVKKADYAAVREVYVKADAAGESQAYDERAEEGECVARFAREEKDKLGQQTAGAVRHVLSEKGVAAEQVDAAGSAASAGQQRAIQKQLEERSREANPAHRYIEENEELLGKQNVETLEKQADELAATSHFVHVVLPREKQRLEALVSDADTVKRTLQDTSEKEKQVAADKATTPRRRKLAETRAKDAEAALARVDESVEKARAALDNLEKRTQEQTDAYEKALQQLLDETEKRAKEQPQAAPAQG
ncbi:MAG TPA: hypothetical protein VLC09_09270 [Polyangiaceae bacterium]|nr:hypothetical protein [Polyangiaceae bacterium]